MATNTWFTYWESGLKELTGILQFLFIFMNKLVKMWGGFFKWSDFQTLYKISGTFRFSDRALKKIFRTFLQIMEPLGSKQNSWVPYRTLKDPIDPGQL